MFRSLPLVQAHLLMTASIPNPDEASSHRESYQRTTDHSWPWTGYRSASRPRSGRATLTTVSRIGQSHPCRWRSRTHLLAIRQCTAQQLHLGAHESYGRSADCCSSRARTVPHNEFPQKDDTQGWAYRHPMRCPNVECGKPSGGAQILYHTPHLPPRFLCK